MCWVWSRARTEKQVLFKGEKKTYLTELQQQTLRAAIDCIIPPDEFPGAWEAGVSDYLARQFKHDLANRFEFYCSGLDGLELEANARFKQSFATLKSDYQNQILREIEIGNVGASWAIPARDFFELLVRTTVEGYYSDPQQGGNRQAASWAMVGFEERETT